MNQFPPSIATVPTNMQATSSDHETKRGLPSQGGPNQCPLRPTRRAGVMDGRR
jgi:hypothetical protein